MTRDLSHIYHRPGELFWLECDPFQQAVPCWQQLQALLFERCVYCQAEVYPAWNTRTSRTYNCKCGGSFKTYGEAPLA